MKQFFSLYSLKYPEVLVYMLQNTDYSPGAYIKWYWRVDDFSKVMYRRRLQRTKPAKLLLVCLVIGMLTQVIIGLLLIILTYRNIGILTFLGWVFILTYPIVWAHLVVVPLIMGRLLIINHRDNVMIEKSKDIFLNHSAVKIVIVGSYGKTTMKELLGTVLSGYKKVAITPANKNVSISHALFANKLTGDEEVLVIEYGESKPGDIKRFAQITRPDVGIITGLAPAHLDKYPDLKSAGTDIFSIVEFVGADNTYVNTDSEATKAFVRPEYHKYNKAGVRGWKVKDVKIDFEGLSFNMIKDKQLIKLKSGLLGRHQIGPLAVVAILSLELGLTIKQVEAGVAKTKSFEHRMQPRSINGAWILDDTYNGNIDGIIAGLKLLEELPAKKKIYVTPGLVDQGIETEKVHIFMGKEIARTNPDVVVLMKNSTTPYIKKGLDTYGYNGELIIETDPLKFYTNIEHFIASGDVMLLQNDWPDNYN